MEEEDRRDNEGYRRDEDHRDEHHSHEHHRPEHHSHEHDRPPEHHRSEHHEQRPHINNEPDKKNPWITTSIILGIAVIVLLFLMYRGGITGGVIGVGGSKISGDEAGEAVLNIANAQGANAELVGVEEEEIFYKVTLKMQGRELPVYVTKNGEYFTSTLIPLSNDVQPSSQNQQTQEVPKSDIPKVELFVWGYCPYGVQAQGPLAEVASLLGDKADFETVLYYDGHGPFETQQNKIQACIQEVAKDKYWQYATGFVEDIYPKCSSSRDVECDKTESINLMKSLGINDAEVMSCVDEEGEALIAEHSARASEYGVTGSPSLVINGVKVNTDRSAEAYKTAVCEAFNEAPADCSEVLDATSATAAGNC